MREKSQSNTPWKLTLVAVMVFAVTLLFLAFPKPAWSHFGPCAPRDIATGNLAGEKYNEQQAAIGLADDGRLVEFWRNPDTGTWTLIITSTRKMSCFIMSGKDWQERLILPGEPS